MFESAVSDTGEHEPSPQAGHLGSSSLSPLFLATCGMSTQGGFTTFSKPELCPSLLHTASGRKLRPWAPFQRSSSVTLLSSDSSPPGPFPHLFTKDGLTQEAFHISKAAFYDISVNFILIISV